MGLDAYFYREDKTNKEYSIPSINITDLANDDENFKDVLTRLAKLADRYGYSFEEILLKAISEYVNNNDYDDRDSLMQFRNFHFLNDYFKYDDSWYDKDKIITKDQCVELRDKAKACIEACDNMFYNLRCKTNCEISFDCDAINRLCKEYFPTDYQDVNLYNKIKTLYLGMNQLIKETNWDDEVIVYNADW